MDLDLTLSALKFANVSTFSRNFGTKKNGSQNGGSLTTEEFNIANAIPFDKMRPIEITENSRTGNVEFDANLVINQSNVTLTINDGTYKGVKVNVFAQTAGNVVHDTNVTDSLQAGERASYQWNGTGWDYVGGTPLGALNYTALCSTALGTAKAVSIPGFTLKTGTTIEVLFANGFYGSASSDTMTLNVNSIGAKKIYACRHGSKIALAPHSCTRDESGDATDHYWFIQANTCLKLMYDATLDSNNGGWLVLGNPIVLSASDTNSSYTVYADGLHVECGYEVQTASSQTFTRIFTCSFSGIPVINATPETTAKDEHTRNMFSIFGISTTQFQAFINSGNYKGMSWIAEGY